MSRDGGRFIVTLAENLACDVCHGGRIRTVGQEIADHPGGTRYRHAMKQQAVTCRDDAAMKPDIWASCLAPNWQREFIDIGREIADAVKSCSRCV